MGKANEDLKKELGLTKSNQYYRKQQVKRYNNEKESQNKYRTINKKQQKKVKDLKKNVDEEKKELGIYEKYKTNQEKMNQNLYISSQDRMKHYTDQSKTKKTAEQKRTKEIKKIQQERKTIEENYKKKSELYKTYEKEKNDSYLTEYLANQERVENEKVTTLDKLNILRPYLANLEDSLDTNHEYTLENGSKVSLPTYRELKSSKVQSEMGKIGQAIHSASGSLGSYTPAMVTSMATSAIPYVGKPLGMVTGGATTLATTYNSAKNRKLLEGYSEKEAENYAKVNASLEAGLGMVLGGLSKTIGGNGTLLTKNLAKVSDKVIKNEGAKYFVNHLVAEEVEELTQMVLDPINEHVTLGEHESISEALSTIDGDEATITALSTLFSIGLTEGPTAFNINTLSKNIDAINKQYGTDFRIKTDSNQVIDSKTNKDATARFEELRRQSKISKYQEEQITGLETRAMQVESDYETGKITEEQYKEETQKISYEAKLFKQEQENNILNPITKIEVEKEILDEKFNSNQITEQEYDKKVAELDNKLKEIAGKEDNTKYSQNENQVPYQYEKSNNLKVNNMKQSASQYFDNAEDTHELINTYEKIIVDKNYNVLFDDTITNIKGESVNAKITTLKNGEVEIRINPNSERAGEFLIMHEVTHAIETDSLKQLVIDFAEQNQDFKKALTDLKQAYGTEDVSSEVLADISGQLLGNQEFINSLKMQNTPESKNIIKQIYESIVRTLNKLTTKGRYRNFVQDLETKWREAYQTQENNLKGETKLSTIGIKGAKNLSKSDVSREYKNLYRHQKVAKDIFKKSKQDMEKTNIITKRNTGWFKTKYGDWGTLISDKNAKLTKKLETNKTYRLGDIFEHDLLYKAYPKLKNLRVETIDFGEDVYAYGAYSPDQDTKGIYLNNFWIENLGNFKGTLLHEINHYIQYEENYDKASKGARLEETNRNSNLGEIISHESKIYSEFTQQELNDIILPELAKNNPNYENIKQKLIEKNERDFDSKAKNKDKGIYDYENNGYTKDLEHSKKAQAFSEKTEKRKSNNLKYDSELDNSSFSLEKLPKVKNGYTRLYRGLNEKYDANYDRSKLDSPNGYDTLTDNYDLAKQYGNNVYYIDIPTNQISNSVIDENPNSETYGDRNLAYKNDKPAGLNGVSGNEYLLYTDHDNFNSEDYHEISENGSDNFNTKYSSKSKDWQEHLEENYKSTGTSTNFRDIRQKSQETNTTEVSKAIEPVMNDIKTISNELKALREELGLKESKVLNPNTIANITKEDASTTPKLPNKKVSTGRGESRFANNIMNKTDMLEDTSKEKILSQDEVKYYEEVTNKESLDKAFDRLENGGASETMSWFNKDSKNADSTDVAEGWILMKQYQDNKDYDGMVQVAKKLREIGTKAGQTVQAFNIMERMTSEGMVKYAQSELSEAYDKMVKNKTRDWIESNRDKFDLTPSEVEFIMNNMEEISTMEDGYDKKVKLAEIQKLMTDKLPPERGAGMKAWMRISMLFNPKTQVRNVLGNATIAPVNAVADTFASMVDKAISKKTGVRTTGMTNLSSYGKGMKEGLYQSYNDFKKGINTRNIQGNRFEIGEGKSFNDSNAVGKALNRVDSLLSFMLDAGDRTFYEASFTNSINNQLVLNKTDVVTQDMIDIATTEALQRTWQDNNTYTKGVLQIRKFLNNANIKGYGLGDVLIPFAKTPANLTKALIDYSPAGMITTITSGINLNRSLSNGQYTAQMQHKFVQNLGKATAGTMLYVLGYALAKSGAIGGEADEDKDVANFMKNTLGTNNYSIKIGNKSFTYDWAQPVAGAFSIMANYVQKTKESENANKLETLIGSLDIAGNILLQQSFLESINTVLNNNEGFVTGLQESLLELPSRAIPTFSKQIADMIDGTQRTSFEKGEPIETAKNKVISKIPFASKSLAPSVDTLGREIQKYGGNNSVFNVFFNPANVNSKNVSESAKEIYRLYQTTGNKQLMPRVAPYDIEIEGKKRLLTSTERANYQKQAGKIVEDAIKELLKSSTYKKLSDADKSKTITDIINYAYNKPQEKYGKSIASEYKNADKYVEKGGTISGYYCINNILKSYDADYEEAKDNLDSSSSNYSAEVDKLSATKRKNIINTIINTNVNKEAKAYLYGKYYGNPETINAIVNSGINFNEYLKFVRTEYSSDKDSHGDTIKNSRKNKIFNAINSLKLTKIEKAMLMRTEYSSFDDYNYEIFEYVNKLSLTKTEKQAIFETLGFEIKGGKIYW